MSFIKELSQMLKRNIREYGMFIALFVIMAFFTIATNGIFISSRNISNLVNQMGYIAVLAIGMTLVIVIRHIDLSVGFLAGFLGAIAAIGLTAWGLPIWFSHPYGVGPWGGDRAYLCDHDCQIWNTFICRDVGWLADLQGSPAASNS